MNEFILRKENSVHSMLPMLGRAAEKVAESVMSNCQTCNAQLFKLSAYRLTGKLRLETQVFPFDFEKEKKF